MDIPGVGLPSTSSGLDVLSYRSIEIKPNDQIAVRDIKSLFSNGGSKQAVNLTLSEFSKNENLLF